jgi:hypothetical protein
MVKCSRNQVARLKKALQREKDLVVRQRIQMILLRADSDDVARPNRDDAARGSEMMSPGVPG